MFEEEKESKIYNLIITNGIDKNNEYSQFIEKLYSKTDFLWKESISPSYSGVPDSFFEKVDVIILLAGLYKDNEEKFKELIKASEKQSIPIVLVKPYGLEEVSEKLEEIATSLVGWNANCIVDTIISATNKENPSCEI